MCRIFINELILHTCALISSISDACINAYGLVASLESNTNSNTDSNTCLLAGVKSLK